MSCANYLNVGKQADCEGNNPKCLVKYWYETCEDCPLYAPKPKVIVKVTVPSVSTLKKRVEAKQSRKDET